MTPEEQRTAEGILYTDLYQLTMAQLYYRMDMHEIPAQFDHFFRSYPEYDGRPAGYCLNAGMDWLLDWVERARFRDRDIEHLRRQTGRAGKPIFDDDFLAWLRENGHFGGLNIEAIPEGRVVHPNVPLTVVRGPLAMAQILESALLNQLNYQVLVATKAARIRQSGRNRPVLEFGMRRAHDRGANAGARAAMIGGCDFTSNSGISCVLGYPPRGTHAHSMVQAFMAQGHSELDAFRAYADVYPDNCLLLVDTVDTLNSGIPNAITVFEELRERGHEPVGIRLDSGDLAHLSVRAARMLNDAGFSDARIVLSNKLDEFVLNQITGQIKEEAPQYDLEPDDVLGRLMYGVGTRLITSRGDAALGGVYKLVGLRDEGRWRPALKVSETPAKVPNPGRKQVWRLYDRRDRATADLLTLGDEDPRENDEIVLRHPTEATTTRRLDPEELTRVEPLLEDVVVEGEVVGDRDSIETIRDRRDLDLERLDPGVKRILNPHTYHVSLSSELFDLKYRLVERAREHGGRLVIDDSPED